MRSPISDFWGKTDRLPHGEWHPLIDHCADVAASCEAIINSSSLRTRLEHLAGRSLVSQDFARLCVLAALHDIGKFNHGFQRKARPGKGRTAGHVSEALQPLSDEFSEIGSQLRSLLADPAEWDPDLALLTASISHHGRPGSAAGTAPRGLWKRNAALDPIAGIGRLLGATRHWFPEAWTPNNTVLPRSAGFHHAFAGLVTLADWVGSDTEFFPYSQEGDGDRMGFARAQAAHAVRAIGLDTRGVRRETPVTFSDFTAYSAPRPTQAAVLAIEANLGVQEGSLVFLEAETGSGKTEAAIARFLRLHESGQVDGMYFAVPTRSAALQLQSRLSDAMERAFGEAQGARPPVTLAVPGYLRFDDSEGKPLPHFRVLWNDSERDQWRHRGWSVENPKRYFAGSVIVGTVDQVLLSALMTNHAAMRATGLLRLLLVIDEVHASDTYMTHISREALRFHLGAGGHAMVMSATLGAVARTKYETLLSAARLPSLAEAMDIPYPRVAVGAVGLAAKPLALDLSAEAEASKQVHWCDKPWAAEPSSAFVTHVREAVQQGARVLIIRNTVADVRSTQRAIEGHGIASLLCNGVPVAHHSRFAPEDRRALDASVEAAFGKTAARDHGLACVATQTVEQSLDIDADLLLTDLCPMDVLLQRIGRLHRHRRARPPGFEQARCIVLVPEGLDLSSYIGNEGKAPGPHGLGTVYRDLRVLQMTLARVRANAVAGIPRDSRALVEATTHPEALAWAEQNEAWRRHIIHLRSAELSEGVFATLNVINREEPYVDRAFVDCDPATRLGEDDRLIHFPMPVRSPLGASIDRVTIPGHYAARLALPVDPAVELVAIDDDSFGFRVEHHSFVYDRLGLQWD